MPDWAVYENVKNIVGKKFKETFDMFISELNEYGYNTYYQVLNAKDYGIPQNRERLYLIAIKKELDNGQFHFPDPIESDIVLKDILEDNVDESYYVNTPRAQELISDLVASGKLDKYSSDNVDINLCGNLYPSNGQNGKVYSTDGIASAISAGTTDTDGNSGIGSNNSPKIVDTSNKSNGRGVRSSIYGSSYDRRITCSLSNQCGNFDKEIELANTLLARDYKGFGNQSMNGVIQYEKK